MTKKWRDRKVDQMTVEAHYTLKIEARIPAVSNR